LILQEAAQLHKEQSSIMVRYRGNVAHLPILALQKELLNIGLRRSKVRTS
jgi:hypothetical protein